MKLPLFLVTGASGVGKSTVVSYLQHLLPMCIIFDMDITYDEKSDWRIGQRNWLRIAKSIVEQGRHVILCGTTLPEHFADHKETSAFSAMYYINLHCDDTIRDARLTARHWASQLIDDHRNFARWLLANADTAFDPPMPTIDTGVHPPDVVATIIRRWVLARMVPVNDVEAQVLACTMPNISNDTY